MFYFSFPPRPLFLPLHWIFPLIMEVWCYLCISKIFSWLFFPPIFCPMDLFLFASKLLDQNKTKQKKFTLLSKIPLILFSLRVTPLSVCLHCFIEMALFKNTNNFHLLTPRVCSQHASQVTHPAFNPVDHTLCGFQGYILSAVHSTPRLFLCNVLC